MHNLTHGIAWAAMIILVASVLEFATAPETVQAGDVTADPLPKGAVARLGSSRLRHTWGVRVLSFSANGKFLVSGGQETAGGGDSALRVWEIPSGREARTIPLGYGTAVRQAVISPDGSKVVWVDGNGAVQGIGAPIIFPILPFDSFQPLKVARGPVPLAFSPDGKYFATGGNGELIVVDVAAKKSVVSAKVGDFHRCVFSPDGKVLAIAHPEAGLRLIDLAADSKTKGKALPFPAIRPAPSSFGFSPDGDQLVTGEAKFVKMWDIAAAKEVRRIAWGDRTTLAVAFSADGKQVTAVGDDARAATWLAVSGKEVQAFALPAKTLPSGMVDPFGLRHEDVFPRIALSTDANWFAVASQDVAIHLVNMTNGEKVTFADGQPGNHSTFAFAFTPDSTHLVTASDEDRLQIWEARTGKLVRTGKEDMQSVYWIGITPNGKQVVSLSYGRDRRETVQLEEWDFATAKRLRQMDLGITPGIPALSPDGTWLALGEPNDSRYRMQNTGDAILVDLATGKQIRHFDAGDESAPQDLTFSSNGKLLATINRTGTIRLWDTATGKLVQTMKAEGSEGLSYNLRFTSSDKTLVSLSMSYGSTGVSSHIVEWSVATGQATTRHEGPKDTYWCQALSPDGKRFAWIGRHDQGRDEQAEVWSVDRQAAQQICEGLRGGARFLGFSPDGGLLAGGCGDGTILIFGVHRERE